MPTGSRRAEAGCVPFGPFQMHFSFKNKNNLKKKNHFNSTVTRCRQDCNT